ncbi:MAG: Dolichyl-phosphate-mannose-protein mannosyltransferase [Chthoniobacter sp.]|jgi:hypothetical protein|nr:Dolichyl-phosphate-mannose-protein mannosyltransferase [Chthoniobacter sp.]
MRWWSHYAALAFVSLASGLLLLSQPGFGDEFTYWSLAFDLHEIGRPAWNVHSFHDLRWPVWGLLWCWQGFFGSGLASFYCVPLLYLVAATALGFTFGRIVLRSLSGAWICGIAVLFAPVLDSVVYRPMPDLPEGFFGACALLAWWCMMESDRPSRAALFGVVSGVAMGLAFSNRITGIFIAPVLVVATLAFFPQRWKWLLVPALSALAFFAVECAVYYSVCGDWLHSFHANLEGRGAKDVEVMPIWRLPIRYLSGFFRGDRLAPIYGVLTVTGLWAGWHRGGRGGRLVVIWFGVLYLEYSCAIQSLHPVRPLIGSTFRYLATLALPMSVLVGISIVELSRFVMGKGWLSPVGRAFAPRPMLTGACVIGFLTLYSSRPFFDPGFTRDLRRAMAALPDGTRIFSHHAMHDLACLVDADVARRFTWIAPKRILLRNEDLEEQARTCDQFWTERKLLWLAERKEVEHDLPRRQPPFGSYIDHPERDWILANVLPKDDEPAFVFYRRRPANAPAPHVLEADSPEFRQLIPPLPARWSAPEQKRIVDVHWTVPPPLRGRLVNLEFAAASAGVEPMLIKLRFSGKDGRLAQYELRPILYADGGEDHFALPIPADAEQCTVEAKFIRKTDEVRLTGFRAVYDETR